MDNMITQQRSPPQSPVDGSMRKRVCKACDRCRLKKSKCDGLNVCSRCRTDNAICVFGERKKSHDKVYPKGYVEMLERQQKQLVAGLQELYRRTQSGLGWDGPPLKETGHGTPLTHDILERLGALKPSRHNLEAEHFEEDLHSLQRRLLAKGAGSIQLATSDSGSESDQSPTFYQTSHKPTFGHPFSPNKLPLTPPTQSPYPENTSPALSHENNNESRLSLVQEDADDSMPSRQMWASSNLALDINMDHLSRYDSPVNLDALPNPFDAEQMLTGTIAPYLSVRDWNRDTDFQSYFSAATM